MFASPTYLRGPRCPPRIRTPSRPSDGRAIYPVHTARGESSGASEDPGQGVEESWRADVDDNAAHPDLAAYFFEMEKLVSGMSANLSSEMDGRWVVRG